MTNRDLYVAVADLVARNADNQRSLEDFLRTLRAALKTLHDEPTLTPDRFLAALEAAFTGPVPPRDPGWRHEDLSAPDEQAVDAASVDRILKSQVLDLEDADASGALRDDYRSFGISVGRPEGTVRATEGHFYNWDPQAFVECGIAGAFGGWQPGDETGRTLVSGNVAVLTDDGIASVPAAEIESPVVDLPVLTWEQIADFLWCGQNYE